MEPRGSFLSLCAHSFMWWLLTNALGAALVCGQCLLLISQTGETSVSNLLGLLVVSLAIPSLAAIYLALLWPVFALLPRWWALAAQRPQARRGRLRLVVLGPFAVFAVCQKLRLHDDELQFTGCYLVASLVAAAWTFRRWLCSFWVPARRWPGARWAAGLLYGRRPVGEKRASAECRFGVAKTGTSFGLYFGAGNFLALPGRCLTNLFRTC